MNPLKKGRITVNSAGVGTVTRKMVKSRAIELAFVDGRSAHQVSASDWAQAQRELTGGRDLDPKEEILESAAESERWDPLPGSIGKKVEVASGEDEDDEGRSDSEQLVNQGIEEADLDQANQASKTDI